MEITGIPLAFRKCTMLRFFWTLFITIILVPVMGFASDGGPSGASVNALDSAPESRATICMDLLGGTKWPIRKGNILYDVSLEDDPIDGPRPVLIRTPLDEKGLPKRNSDGQIRKSITPLIIDDLTNSLSSKTKIVKELLDVLIHSANRRPFSTAYVQIDLNDLSSVNNFIGKQTDGNNYIKRVSAAIRAVCVPSTVTGDICQLARDSFSPTSDWIFRDGGDELVLLIPNIDQEDLSIVLNRIADSLSLDVEAQGIFERNRQATLESMNQILEEKYSADIVDEVRQVLAGDHKNFAQLKRSLGKIIKRDPELLAFIKAYDKARRLSPTVSIGSAFIGPNDTYEDLNSLTSRQSYEVKSEHKRSIGLDPDKYGPSRRTTRSGPKSLRPEIRPALTTGK